MAKVVKSIRDSDMMIVTFDHPCGSAVPGQTVNINGRFFAIAEADENSVSVLTRYGGPLDLPEGTEVNMTGPLGKGFPAYDSWDAVIVCGGTATGVGLNLLKYRLDRGLRTWFVSYTRGGNPYAKTIDDLSSAKCADFCMNWNTRELDRPAFPYSPLHDSKFPAGTVVFVAGPKELVESCQASAEQFGIDPNNIHLNY
jgi:hypothetical protein